MDADTLTPTPAAPPAVETIKVLPDAPAAAPAPAPVLDFSAFLTPGADVGNTPGFEAGRSQGTGLCDGVIYLTGRNHPVDGHVLFPDRFKDALRFVKPAPLDFLAFNPGKIGRLRPSEIWSIIGLDQNSAAAEEILALCKGTKQQINWMFTYSQRALKATMRENVSHWYVVKAQEGVWGVIWH